MANNYRVSFSEDAINDLLEIESYYVEEIYNERALLNLVQKLYSFTDLLEVQPRIGSMVDKALLSGSFKENEIRKFPIKNIVVLYEIRGTEIEVIGFVNALLDYTRVVNKRLR